MRGAGLADCWRLAFALCRALPVSSVPAQVAADVVVYTSHWFTACRSTEGGGQPHLPPRPRPCHESGMWVVRICGGLTRDAAVRPLAVRCCGIAWGVLTWC